MKAHTGVDAGTGYVHSVTATAANIYDLDEATSLGRDDDEVVYADAGYQAQPNDPRSPGMNTDHASSGGSPPAKES